MAFGHYPMRLPGPPCNCSKICATTTALKQHPCTLRENEYGLVPLVAGQVQLVYTLEFSQNGKVTNAVVHAGWPSGGVQFRQLV